MENKLTAVRTSNLIHSKTGRSYIGVFLDIVRSYFEYGSSLEDYLDFDFISLESNERRKYVTSRINRNYIRRNNHLPQLNRKEVLEKYINDFDYACIENCEEFLLKHESFIASSLDGKNRALINQNSYGSKKALIDDLNKHSLVILEEKIEQNKVFTSLSNEYCLVRLYLAKGDDISILGSTLNIGFDDRLVLNIDDGMISKPAIGKDHNSYRKNPDTNTMLIGLKIPMYKEILMQASKLMENEENNYVSFDFVVSKDKVYLYDLSYQPDICLMQNKYFEIYGLKERLDELFKFKRNKYTSLVKMLFVLSVNIFISLLFNLPFVFMMEFVLFYLLVYRNIDTRMFYKTCLLSFGISLLVMILSNVILPLFISSSFIGSDLFVLTLIYLIYISIVYSLLSVLISIVLNYLVYPFLNGIIESLNFKKQLAVLSVSLIVTVVTVMMIVGR